MTDSMSIYSEWATKASDSDSESEKLKIIEDESSVNSPSSESSKIKILEDITIYPVSKVKCQFCEKKVDEQDYEEHKKNHEEIFFPCSHPDCNKKFKRKSSLRKHLYFHQGKFKYECDKCKAQFIDLNKFQLHQTIKHKALTSQDKFKCDEPDCGRTFAISEYLRRHQVTHNDDYKYSCRQCDQKFKWLSSLQSHQTVHDRTSTLQKCKHCQKSFSNRKILERHIKIHKNVKYKCVICQKATSARKDNIRRHIKHLHSEIEKPEITKYIAEYQAMNRQGIALEISDDTVEDNSETPADEAALDYDCLGLTSETPQEDSSLPQQPVFNNRVNVIQSIGNPNKSLPLSENCTEIGDLENLIHQVEEEPEKHFEKEIQIKLPPKKNPIALGLKNSPTSQTKPKYDPIEQYRKILLGTSNDPVEEDQGIPTQIHWRKRASQNFLCHQ